MNEEYETQDQRMVKYVSLVKQRLGIFAAWKLEYIPRDSNEKADTLAAMAASISIKEMVFLLIYYQPALSIATVSHPQPQPKRMKGARNCTGTLYLLFQTLVIPSLITESQNHIKIYKNKTTTVVGFTVSIHTVLSPIYIYTYKNCTFTFT